MVARKPDLAAEAVRISGEYEEAVLALEAAEKDAEAEMRKIAGAMTLGETTMEEARQRREAIDADLRDRRERLAILRDAVPDIERRRVEEEQHQRKLAVKKSGDALMRASQAKYNAVKLFVKALREVEATGSEVLRHRGLEAEVAERHRELVGDEFEYPKTTCICMHQERRS